ncbi:stage II sporulation protein E (SpoIIE) [Clostridium homopropionicum DSM 5847]|uniref:Stage II sporulation protein E (SpoIIE) n=1 Tax=Clostridium homopropionicum DSM 5847 TaxID=1121318 RepID=A0A0L6Z9V9_9CLOT|nr:SpoIIE family protein phosphatase [Clostridium homopropionicum]KOA19750.1 stage II sporulation protein E (SpoIIE) [Clostridium homopropionicum DSM 5847]SFF78325.1 Serine phosphatase RsbU, regulator of sigma subunit [Clostridium homopropionicum]
MFFNKIAKEEKIKEKIIDDSTIKLIFFANTIIVIAVCLMGLISYRIAKYSIVEKLKSRDLKYIAQSITSKIDGRISRAKETSFILAKDPVIREWLVGKEENEALGIYAKEKITDIAKKYDYDNSFIVSNLTKHYWAEGGKLIDTLSEKDPDDSWFFSTIKSKGAIDISIDYNKERKDTFVFINALVGNENDPLGITGVGLSLKDISKEFEGYKFGDYSNMWLIDKSGRIYLSEDIEHSGKNINEFLPTSVTNKIVNNNISNNLDEEIFDYNNSAGETFDVVCMSIKSANWELVFQMPRSESISMVNGIKLNTSAASFVIIILIVFIFYIISNRISNPYKRAVLLSQELEKKVEERTKELKEKNDKILDSIEYAKIIQESTLPTSDELNSLFREYFVLWRPRDIVGGDFYFIKKFTDGYILILGDCTGHGVPGALMTMSINSILNHIINESNANNPALILSKMNKNLKETLHNKNNVNGIDDGLDAAIIYVSKDNKLIYAGAKIPLYKKHENDITFFKADTKGIGYRNTSDDFQFTNVEITFKDEDIFYITTDGYIDQNGGEKDLPYGKNRLKQLILSNGENSLEEQKSIFENSLNNYMNGEAQRDDITMVGFKP